MAIRLLEGARRKLPLLFLLLAVSAWSQNQSRRPDLLTEVPNVLCDAFLFEAKEAAGIIAVYSQCRSEAMEGIRSQFSNWRTMTREDRLQIFRDMNKHINRAFMEKTKAYFAKEEMVSVEKILAKQPAVDIELHALRLLELPKEHTKSLRASALAVVLVSPPRYLSRALEQSEEERQREEADWHKAKTQLQQAIQKQLSAAQQRAWSAKIKELQNRAAPPETTEPGDQREAIRTE